MAKKKNPPREVRRFNLAIPDELWEPLQRVASRDRRSVTAQIICAIEWMVREEVKNEPTAAP